MLTELKKETELNYLNQRNQILKKNILYLQKYCEEETAEKEELSLEIRKTVIPLIERMPRYRFYAHLDEQLPVKDDPVLRFVPILPGTKEYLELHSYESTDLVEKPFNKEMQINELMMKEILKKYSNFQLFHLKKLLNNKSEQINEVKNEFIDLIEFSLFSKITLNKILAFWESIFDKNRVSLFSDPDSLDYYFCNVCYSFDCLMHEGYLGLKLALKKKNETLSSTELIHRKICVEMGHKKTENTIENILNIHKKEYDFINSNYDVDPCTASLFFYFCTGEKLPNHIFPKCKEKFLTKKCGNLVQKRKPNTNFFFPCHHKGSCVNNAECSCNENKNYCEESCLCTECNNFFEGCDCLLCSLECRCRIMKRECSAFCKCSKCLNKFFTFKQYKKTFIGKSRISNFGLFAGENIPKDSFIIEYTGEVISNGEAERRGNFYESLRLSYLFDVSFINKTNYHTLDAMFVGNNSRFGNHSSKPNMVAQNFLVNGIRRIGFFANEDIRIHTELFLNYQYTEEHKIKHGIIE